MSADSPGPPQPQQLRTLASALIVSPIVITIALSLTAESNDPLALWVVGAVVAAVAVGFLLAETFGFRVPPLTNDVADVATAANGAYVQAMIMRFVLTEAPIMAAVALTFLVHQGIWPLAIAVVAGVPSMAVQVWPSGRNVRRVADRLESGGVRSGLREAFGV